MPKTGIEPISKSYKESVLPIKLFRLIFIYPLSFPLTSSGDRGIIRRRNPILRPEYNKKINCPGRELNSHIYIFRIALWPLSNRGLTIFFFSYLFFSIKIINNQKILLHRKALISPSIHLSYSFLFLTNLWLVRVRVIDPYQIWTDPDSLKGSCTNHYTKGPKFSIRIPNRR